MTDMRKTANFFKSSRLYANSNFLIGLGSTFNIPGNYFDYNYSKSGKEADWKAIGRDWDIVGHNLNNSIPVLNKTESQY